MELAQNIQAVRAKIAQAAADAGRTPGEITLCAATKVQTDETIRAAIAAGVQVCGENRVQELTAHLEAGAYEGARVHFIGHLQTNKVKQVVGKVELIHSVDSERLLRAIHSQAEKLGIVQDILLEVNIAGEESKGGCSPQEAEELARLTAQLPHVRLRGLMAIPPVSLEIGSNRPYFQAMRQLFVDIKEKMSDNQASIDCLSMGMSGDYADAIAEGSTLVRVGTALFGPRPPMGTPRTDIHK
ncbi:Predicted enzyme with a TIM-barrel fold [uncultured Clostridium sp.]|uniref:YggS family pyridoxal phosphate-dependent enzyme n=1 Tax=Muriventricola aceti TaxID=2981773 RepID=UPI000820D196|nr:YggS family pyridoxal phosphate-dependent enzyme [Muriventricola aceti]MCU6702325.1 YggS family pyridoxal phosphate-dependent enzyme [Muriventricola aceti]SCH37324.1 Predicted enzyme with a TIM-barrel fold [uncultured Clostridium sp.]SCJ00195.1 Predicted enzyme with a TIM-barrel fold [uncultured Flavonifractor sp.]